MVRARSLRSIASSKRSLLKLSGVGKSPGSTAGTICAAAGLDWAAILHPRKAANVVVVIPGVQITELVCDPGLVLLLLASKSRLGGFSR